MFLQIITLLLGLAMVICGANVLVDGPFVEAAGAVHGHALPHEGLQRGRIHLGFAGGSPLPAVETDPQRAAGAWPE